MLNKINVLDKGYIAYIDHMGSDLSVIRSAKQSVGKEVNSSSDEDRQFIRNLMRWGHHTPFEFITVTFRVKAPLFIYRQWHRSRTQSYVERSGRYTELLNEFYVPDDSVITFKNPDQSEKLTVHNVKNPDDWWDLITPKQLEESGFSWSDEFAKEQDLLRSNYERWVKSGCRKEIARLNSPLSQYSEMYMTTDLRNLFHFLQLRLNSGAQWEIRQYANAILELITPLFPLCVEAFKDYQLNSVILSKGEQTVLTNMLKDLLGKDPLESLCPQEYTEKEFENKREREECLDKIYKLFGK